MLSSLAALASLQDFPIGGVAQAGGRLGVLWVARCTVGYVRYDGIGKSREKATRADCFVIRMGDNHERGRACDFPN